MAYNLGFGEHFCEVIKDHGYDKTIRPYYEAIKALTSGAVDTYLNTIASEIREPAKVISEKMLMYINA